MTTVFCMITCRTIGKLGRYLSAIFAGGELLALGVLLKHVIAQAVPPHKLLAAHGAG
jgi:hypothetical protein